MKKRSIQIIVLLTILLTLTFSLIYLSQEDARESQEITDFEECIAAGNPVMESLPRKCSDANTGQVFVEVSDFGWEDDGVYLAYIPESDSFGCFGCGATLCIDPAPSVKMVNETESRHCNNNFEIVS